MAVPLIDGGDIRFLVMPPGASRPAAGPLGHPRARPVVAGPGPRARGEDSRRGARLAFDRSGNRLGRGKGYYDRFLLRARAAGARLVVIGICFSDQLVDEVPHSDADQAVDGVVTDTETLLVDRAGLIQ